jgi:hypothetical protein
LKTEESTPRKDCPMNSNAPESPTVTPKTSDEAPASPAPTPPAHRRGRKRNPYRHAERPAVPLMLTVQEAAETLRTTVEALRARLRRHQVADADGSITAPLGSGITGVKLGANTWRVRIDNAK